MIKEQWESYREEVMPKNAHPIQVSECQLAFYAGIAAMLSIVLYGSLEDQEGVQGELQEFVERVKRGEVA